MRKVMSVVMAGALGVGAWVGAARADDARGAKRSGVSLRLASTNPIDGFKAASLGGARMFVSPKASLTGADVTSALAIEVRDGRDVELTLTAQAAGQLASALRATGANRLAAYQGGEMLAAGDVVVDAAVSRATIRGLTTANAERLVRLVNVQALPAASSVRMVASQQSIQPGGSVSVDLFLDGTVESLRGYQFSFAAIGGDAGTLSVGGGSAAATGHPDFVFGAANALQAVDKEGGRMMAALVSGAVNVARSSYLGTMTFQASPDAKGTFAIRVVGDPDSSVLLDSGNMPVAFDMPEPVMVRVGDARSIAPTRR